MASAWCSVIPMSSRPLRNRSCVDGSMGNEAVTPIAGASTVSRSRSTVISRDGSASIAASSCLPTSADTCTGTSPFLVQLLRKMSAKRGEITASKPYCWIAHTACSRDEPVPKLGPATRILAPAKRSSLSTKLRSSRHSENRPFSKPVRSTCLSQSEGMIWSVSTSDRSSGTARPLTIRTARMVSSLLPNWFLQIFGGGEVAGDGGGGGDGGGDEVGATA